MRERGTSGDDPSSMLRILDRNIAALVQRRQAEETEAGFQQRVSNAISGFAGSVSFVYIHLAFFGVWIIANLGWLPLSPWDPSMVGLAMIASVEAIFLSTFVLITQNRMSAEAEKRAELDLQISLLTEHEVTKVMQLLGAVAAKHGISVDDEAQEVQQHVRPERVIDRIESAGGRANNGSPGTKAD